MKNKKNKKHFLRKNKKPKDIFHMYDLDYISIKMLCMQMMRSLFQERKGLDQLRVDKTHNTSSLFQCFRVL